MSRYLLLTAFAVLTIGFAEAQTAPVATPPPTPAVTDALPANHVDAGVFYNSLTKPAVSGWGAYSHKIADGTYSYSLADVTAGTLKPFNPKITTSSGLAQRLTTFSDITVFGIGTVGVTTTAGSTGQTGFAATAGFLLVKPLKNNWTLDVPIRAILGTGPPQYVFGIGFGWGK